MSLDLSPTSGAALEIIAVEKSYGTYKALRRLDLSVRRGEFLTLLGPSGSGKTTLLKAIAGFEAIDDGAIRLEGSDVAVLPPARRDIGMVFQNYALFPHMTVAENVAFPLRMRGVARAEIAQRVADALRRVDLPDHGGRYPRQLSGGQQQRVALARAVVFGPRLLLLDEPFGALDRKLREGMQDEVRDLQRRLGLTTVFITHDQEEALALSDRIAVMDAGRILQTGAPEEIYDRPIDRFTAAFLGESNLFPAKVRGVLASGVDLALDAGPMLHAPLPDDSNGLAPGAEVTVMVRPENLVPTGGGRPVGPVLRARLIEAVFLGPWLRWRLETPPDGTGKTRQLILRQPVGGSMIRPQPGDVIELGWAPADCRVLVR